MATPRLKVKPQLGRMPTLQFCRPAELRIDPGYQRDASNGSSQALIRRIAQNWNWDLCQPLVVARRVDLTERLFVIDGQHRLEAARLRGDIEQLPCVIVNYAKPADEAASFVHLNQQRRPLSKLDVFRAAVASEDAQACAIIAAMAEAGLSVAPHNNHTAWKPGMVTNIGGIEAAWRVYGPKVVTRAMTALRLGFDGQVLRYAGTIFPGIVAACSVEIAGKTPFTGERFERFYGFLAKREQSEWRNLITRIKGDEPLLKFAAASAAAIRREWHKELGADAAPRLQFKACADGKAFCAQCDDLITEVEAAGCKSRFCSLKAAA